MNSTTASSATARLSKSLDLGDAASPLSLMLLTLGQVYLIYLVASSLSTLTQAMLMICVECLFIWLLTTLFFSRTWSGFFMRCRDLLIMSIVLLMLLSVFAYAEVTWARGAASISFEEMRAALTVNRFNYAFLYIAILTGGWLVMAWQSGRARIWWAANVAAPASLIFAAMFVAFAAAIVLIVGSSALANGLAKIGLHADRVVQVLRDISPMLLLIVYGVTRIFLGWKMATGFTAEDWRKAEAGLYFDAPESTP